MKKTIIHQKYELGKISFDKLSKLHDMIKSTLSDDYIVITTPTDISKIDGETIVITIDAKGYTTNELIEIIEKANMYDGLNK